MTQAMTNSEALDVLEAIGNEQRRAQRCCATTLLRYCYGDKRTDQEIADHLDRHLDGDE